MILETLLTEEPHLLHVQYLDQSLVQGGVAVHREQTLSHLCALSYNVAQPLHMYFFAIAPFKFGNYIIMPRVPII
jgi:hypothetical protein